MIAWPAAANDLNRRRQYGMTLLELLVAVLVFVVISAAAYSGLQSVLRTRAVVEQQARRLGQVQMAWFFLERDMEQAIQRGIRDEYGQRLPALAGGGALDEIVTLTRAGWDNPLGRQRATLQRLSYRISQGQLIRLYWDTLDSSGLREPLETMLLDKVQAAEIRFLDDENDWQAQWPMSSRDEQSDGLPRAVEFSLILEDWGTIRRLFRLAESES